MADWKFNIWVGDLPVDGIHQNAVKLRHYKRPQWVTQVLPKIVLALEAYVEVTLNGEQVQLLAAKRWLQPENGDPPDWERYFGKMMEQQRYYEREKTRIRTGDEND